MNSITISGHIGSDAETREVGQDTVTSFSVAHSKKQKSGDVTMWFRASLWGKRGESLREYLRKGTPVTVVGELSERTYEKDGQTRHALDVRVSDIALQGGKREENGTSQPKPRVDGGEDPDWMNEP